MVNAVIPDNRRPYAAPSNVIAVIERVRSRNLPESIDGNFLRLANVPETVHGRVFVTLQFLDLIEADGRPTDKLRAMAGAPDAQYRDLLADTVRAAYRADFVNVDPSQDSQAKIVDAFRPYEPRSQTDRMVMLFLGLCREARIPTLDAPRERKMQESRPRAARNGKARSAPTQGRNGTGRERGQSREDGERRDDFHASPTLVFGVTEEDIGVLSEDEFNEVWGALGKLARARARAKQRTATVTATADNTADDTEE